MPSTGADGLVNVACNDGKRFSSCHIRHIRPVRPVQGDFALVLSGPNKGKAGKIISSIASEFAMSTWGVKPKYDTITTHQETELVQVSLSKNKRK